MVVMWAKSSAYQMGYMRVDPMVAELDLSWVFAKVYEMAAEWVAEKVA